MNFSFIPETVSITDVQRKAPEVLRGLHRSRGARVIMSHNKPAAVLMSPAAYHALMEELRHARELAEVRQIIAEGDADLKAGRTIRAKSLSEAMKKAAKTGLL